MNVYINFVRIEKTVVLFMLVSFLVALIFPADGSIVLSCYMHSYTLMF